MRDCNDGWRARNPGLENQLLGLYRPDDDRPVWNHCQEEHYEKDHRFEYIANSGHIVLCLHRSQKERDDTHYCRCACFGPYGGQRRLFHQSTSPRTHAHSHRCGGRYAGGGPIVDD